MGRQIPRVGQGAGRRRARGVQPLQHAPAHAEAFAAGNDGADYGMQRENQSHYGRQPAAVPPAVRRLQHAADRHGQRPENVPHSVERRQPRLERPDASADFKPRAHAREAGFHCSVPQRCEEHARRASDRPPNIAVTGV